MLGCDENTLYTALLNRTVAAKGDEVRHCCQLPAGAVIYNLETTDTVTKNFLLLLITAFEILRFVSKWRVLNWWISGNMGSMNFFGYWSVSAYIYSKNQNGYTSI